MGLPSLCCKLADLAGVSLQQTDSQIGDLQRLINPGRFDKARTCRASVSADAGSADDEIYFHKQAGWPIAGIAGQVGARKSPA
jgi:hypothetical protein